MNRIGATHPSHAMGTVIGESCCVICYAGPADPIVEDPCDQSIREPERKRLIATALASGDLLAINAPSTAPAPPDERRRLRQARAKAAILRAHDGDLTSDEISKRLRINPAHVARVLRDAGLTPGGWHL